MFRFTFTRTSLTSLCFQIDTFMGIASILSTTVASVLDNIGEMKTEKEMP